MEDTMEDTIWLTNRFVSYIREKNFALKSASVELSTPCAQGRRGLEFIPIYLLHVIWHPVVSLVQN